LRFGAFRSAVDLVPRRREGSASLVPIVGLASEAALEGCRDAFKSSRNAFMMLSDALWFIFVLIAG
jgi:hypothetical protein